MAKLSAGIVLVRIGRAAGNDRDKTETGVLLVHPGGPLWRNKDVGAWSIPKGEYSLSEDPQQVALREFEEELGVPCPTGVLLPLGSVRQSGGKLVTAWCAVGDIDTTTARSNTFDMIWPPRSGEMQTFPEVDRAEFFAPDEAGRRILASQRSLIERALAELCAASLL